MPRPKRQTRTPARLSSPLKQSAQRGRGGRGPRQRRCGRLPSAAQVQPPVSVRAASPGSSAEERHAVTVSVTSAPNTSTPSISTATSSRVGELGNLPSSLPPGCNYFAQPVANTCTTIVLLLLGLWLILLQAQRLGVTLVIVVLMWV